MNKNIIKVNGVEINLDAVNSREAVTNPVKQMTPEQKKKVIAGLVILGGLGTVALITGSNISSNIRSNRVQDVLDNNVNNSIGNTKSLLANNGIDSVHKFNSLKPEQKTNLINSFISKTKVGDTGETLTANILNQAKQMNLPNANPATLNEFLKSPTFKSTPAASKATKNILGMIANKRDINAFTLDESNAIFDAYKTWIYNYK